MSFWTDTGAHDPKRNFRFRVRITGFTGNDTIVWWAKKVQKPNYSVAEIKHVFLSHTYYYPGKLEWQEITMTLVDPAGKADETGKTDALQKLNEVIVKSGYQIPNQSGAITTLSKNKSAGALNGVVIEQLDDEGKIVEKWTLKNPFLKKVSFSDLDYENDDLTTIDIALRYDWAVCNTGTELNGNGFFEDNGSGNGTGQ